ncbi:MAG: deoxyribonuclease IV [Armatimonadetes bacterium]|nr:deoxyribonuclease IV [Armatimonadota bacterium]
MRFGFHITIAGGWRKTIERAVERRCTALQVFTSAPVQWDRKPMDLAGAQWFAETLRALDIQPLFVHAIYLLNLATPAAVLWRRSRDHLTDELRRAKLIGAHGVVFHLGSVGAEGKPEAGMRRVARALDWAAEHTPDGPQLILENSSVQGNVVGGSVESIAQIIDMSHCQDRLNVCIDTAHAFAQGYPVHDPVGLEQFLDHCDAAFGLERLALIHANDSRSELGSHVDRHAHIGKGKIGRAGFRAILNEPRLRHLPFILETPDQEEWHAKDLRALRSVVDAAIRPALPRIRPVPEQPKNSSGRGGSGRARDAQDRTG